MVSSIKRKVKKLYKKSRRKKTHKKCLGKRDGVSGCRTCCKKSKKCIKACMIH